MLCQGNSDFPKMHIPNLNLNLAYCSTAAGEFTARLLGKFIVAGDDLLRTKTISPGIPMSFLTHPAI